MALELIKYADEQPCNNCGRARVELYSDGRLICEKCMYNQTTNEYEDEDELFEQMYPKFADRKGRTINGVFVKESDLQLGN